jgi:beta-glucosidase
LTEKDIDQSLRTGADVRFRLGEFDPPEMVPYSKLGPETIDSPAHIGQAGPAYGTGIDCTAGQREPPSTTGQEQGQNFAVIGPFADYAQTGPNYTG